VCSEFISGDGFPLSSLCWFGCFVSDQIVPPKTFLSRRKGWVSFGKRQLWFIFRWGRSRGIGTAYKKIAFYGPASLCEKNLTVCYEKFDILWYICSELFMKYRYSRKKVGWSIAAFIWKANHRCFNRYGIDMMIFVFPKKWRAGKNTGAEPFLPLMGTTKKLFVSPMTALRSRFNLHNISRISVG
jgi:hypothetical protein